MRKIIFLLVAVISIMNVTAQEIDSIQSKSTPISIDSLSAKLNKLEHDFHYLQCKYELNQSLNELLLLMTDIISKTNEILIIYSKDNLNKDLYFSIEDLQKKSYELFERYQQTIELVTTKVSLLSQGFFTEKETEELRKICESIDVCISKIESALDGCEKILEKYINKRKK